MRIRRGRVVAALCAVSLFVAACGGDDDGVAEPGPVTEAPDDEEPAPDEDGDESAPDDGDEPDATVAPGEMEEVDYDPEATIRFVFGFPPIPLDPHTGPSYVSIHQWLSPVVDRLIQSYPTGLEPMLATSWEFAADGSYLELELRQGVEFHDGEPFNAEAVKANIDRALSVESSTVAPLLAMVDAVEVVDEFTVRILLNGPGAELPALLAQAAGTMRSPASLDAPDADLNPVGSGPYQLVEYELGVRAVYERVEDLDYWDDTAGRAARLEITGVTDVDAKFNALLTGQADGIYEPRDPTRMAELGQGDYDLYSLPGRTQAYFYLNRETPGLDDPLVRRAIHHAIDKPGFIDAFMAGLVEPAYQPFREGAMGHDPSLDELYPNDLEEARRLLEEAGYSDGLDLGTVFFGLGNQNLAEAVQGMLAEIGITFVLEGVDPVQAVSQYTERRPAGMVNPFVGFDDPAQTVNVFYLSQRNIGPIPDEFVELAADARDQTLSADERDELYQQISRVVVEEVWGFPIHWWGNFQLVVPKMKGIEGHPFSHFGVPESRHWYMEN